MKTNIALVGFMGVGKTTVGQALAKRLNRKFIELDSLIEQKAGKSIPAIFQQDGEIAFREMEIEAIKEISQMENIVIACGGGVVLNQINVDRLKQKSVIVYLTASPATLLKRILNERDKRPLLKADNPALVIRDLLKFRKPLYERAADIKIDTTKLDIHSIVAKIINDLRKDENFNL